MYKRKQDLYSPLGVLPVAQSFCSVYPYLFISYFLVGASNANQLKTTRSELPLRGNLQHSRPALRTGGSACSASTSATRFGSGRRWRVGTRSHWSHYVDGGAPHLPVSYIAGTSMGGLVGGIYATGRSPAEVKDLINEIDWDQVLNGATPFRDLSFRRKQDAHELPGSLEFGLRNGLQFPGGFNTGQEVDLILDRVALPYSELTSFNDLPIPFACVATDLALESRPHRLSGRSSDRWP